MFTKHSMLPAASRWTATLASTVSYRREVQPRHTALIPYHRGTGLRSASQQTSSVAVDAPHTGVVRGRLDNAAEYVVMKLDHLVNWGRQVRKAARQCGVLPQLILSMASMLYGPSTI